MNFVNALGSEVLEGRVHHRDEDLRGPYFRDITAIIHSYPFRRLKHKTQVFFAPKNDHICTRIEHVMHVASIASTICRALKLDADLAWAIGLGHDLGHTPFGHLGEEILSEITSVSGGFSHELYSLRVIDFLANHGKGLNLTYAVRDGIINHCGEQFEQSILPDFEEKDLSSIHKRDRYPSTWEGCAVRMSDKIAYLGRDLEDALHLRLVKPEMVPESVVRVLGKNNSEIINTLVLDLIENSGKTGSIGFSDRVFAPLLSLKDFNYRYIYRSPVLFTYHGNFERILKTLHTYLSDLFVSCGEDFLKYRTEKNFVAARFGDYLKKMRGFYVEVDGGYSRAVTDYLAGMTDDYAIDCVSEIMMPKLFESQFEGFLFEE